MKLPIDKRELKERIALSYNRFVGDEYYRIGGVFSPDTYDWPGDKEGRALLAFVSHYKISGKKIPCMREMLGEMEKHLNARRYMGEASEYILEQQLSGHSWLLRGLCEHHEQFGDAYTLSLLKDVTENLYLPTAGKYRDYPVDREQVDRGGVSGTELGMSGIWRLSTDIGCAFMSIDGLSHVYRITMDWRVKELVDEMIDVYLAIDKKKLRAQTHCTLTAARGMMRMYWETMDEKYLSGAKDIWELYVNGGGMTLSYQNLNWWGRPNSWTEPCAIVDSLMLSTELFKATEDEKYRTLAARVWHNGLSPAQRDNGGAGTDTIVFEGSGYDYIAAKSYEAPFCCTMRLAEGLWYVNENQDLLYAETTGQVVRTESGVYMDGDILYAEPDQELAEFAASFTEVDGRRLAPVVKYFRVPREILMKGRQRILFD